MDNQTPDFVDQDAFTLDQALVEGVLREGAGWARPGLEQGGLTFGTLAPGCDVELLLALAGD